MFCFSETCRICKRSSNSIALTCYSQKELSNMFFRLFPELMNSKLNHFLKNLCVSCEQQLLSFDKFKNHCMESDECYMRYLNQLEGYDGMHAELVCELSIKQEECWNDDSQIQPIFKNYSNQEASSSCDLIVHPIGCYSSAAEDVRIDIVKQEISMSDIKEEKEGAISADGISILNCEESGSEEIRDTLPLTSQELFVCEYRRSSDDENVAVNENEIAIKLETVELSSYSGIEDLHLKAIDYYVDIRTENSIINMESCHKLSSTTEDDITEIDIVKHEVCVADKGVSYNSIDLSVNNNENQQIDSKKHSLNDQLTHTGEKFYQCDICTKSFSVKYNLKVHQRTHSGEKPYQCDICEKSFSRQYQVVEHKRNHTGEKPYQCDNCKKSFSLKSNLKVHQRTHTGEKPFQCDICTKIFSAKSSLKVHQRTHTGEKPYQCHICKESFSRQFQLIEHKRNHTGENPYECDICKKIFSTQFILERHKRIHTGEKPYQCDICKKGFSRQCHMLKHKRIHIGEKPYQCDLCNKSFLVKEALITHKRIHTGEKPYDCEICKQSFSSKWNMIIHKRTHTGEKPYECDICKKSFSIRSNLKNHKRIHTGEKPYQCDICKKCFSQLPHLKTHKAMCK